MKAIVSLLNLRIAENLMQYMQASAYNIALDLKENIRTVFSDLDAEVINEFLLAYGPCFCKS